PAARRLLERGHEVRVLTRQLSPALPGGAAAVRGDLSTGAGVAQAVERADAVLHAASNTGLGLGRGDVEATRRLLDAALGAGVARGRARRIRPARPRTGRWRARGYDPRRDDTHLAVAPRPPPPDRPHRAARTGSARVPPRAEHVPGECLGRSAVGRARGEDLGVNLT